jgi:hypothetical protein
MAGVSFAVNSAKLSLYHGRRTLNGKIRPFRALITFKGARGSIKFEAKLWFSKNPDDYDEYKFWNNTIKTMEQFVPYDELEHYLHLIEEYRVWTNLDVEKRLWVRHYYGKIVVSGDILEGFQF